MNAHLAEICRLQYPSICNEWFSCWSLQVAVSIYLLWMVLFLKYAGCNNHLCAMNGHLAEICRFQYPSVCYEWSSCWSLQDAVSIFMLWMALFLRSACCSIHLSVIKASLTGCKSVLSWSSVPSALPVSLKFYSQVSIFPFAQSFIIGIKYSAGSRRKIP